MGVADAMNLKLLTKQKERSKALACFVHVLVLGAGRERLTFLLKFHELNDPNIR